MSLHACMHKGVFMNIHVLGSQRAMKREMTSSQTFPSSAFSLRQALHASFDAWWRLLLLLMSCRWPPGESRGPLSFPCCIICQQWSCRIFFSGTDLWEQNMSGTFHISIGGSGMAFLALSECARDSYQSIHDCV